MTINGAQSLIRTLTDSGVDVCFMNPGTSEMHFVAALDEVPEMRGVLTLFEGVATGAADGYGRMADRPASVLLHLGPGLANGIANLHNARRARSPLVNIVGDHATDHLAFDAPLTSDIAALAGTFSGWVRTSSLATEVASDTAEAVAAAMAPARQVATLILPADVSWGEANGPAAPVSPTAATPSTNVDEVAAILAASPEPGSVAFLLGGSVCDLANLEAAAQVCHSTGAKLLAETFPTRIERGAGRPSAERLAYLADFAAMQIGEARHLILVGAVEPVAFFGYPDADGLMAPEGCEIHTLTSPGDDHTGALLALAEMTGAAAAQPAAGRYPVAELSVPELPTGELTANTVCQAIGALMPEGAIVSDEGNTAGIYLSGYTAGAPPHDWLCLTGGAIGQGMPVATGAAMACPGRRVINVEADGSAMYTIQSLWSQAREGLDVTTIILNNGSYNVLNMELDRVGAEPPGPRAKAMLDISGPRLDFVAMSQGLGVPATRSTTSEEFVAQLQRSLATEGPSLIEAMIPPGF